MFTAILVLLIGAALITVSQERNQYSGQPKSEWPFWIAACMAGAALALILVGAYREWRL